MIVEKTVKRDLLGVVEHSHPTLAEFVESCHAELVAALRRRPELRSGRVSEYGVRITPDDTWIEPWTLLDALLRRVQIDADLWSGPLNRVDCAVTRDGKIVVQGNATRHCDG